MKKIICLLPVCCALLLTSCQFGTSFSSSSSNSNSNSNSESNSNSTSQDLDQDALYDELYAYNSDIKIDLYFTNQAIYKLADYCLDETKKEMYHPCDMTIAMNGVTYHFDEVGARMKGNTSRDENFVDENGMFHSPVHFKLSLKETFDDAEDNDYYIRTWSDDKARGERKDREFAKQQKFDLKWNKSEDNSFTKQIYAYYAFENEGLMASKVNLVDVTVHSESDSMHYVYQLQETIDKDFLKQRMAKDEAQGNLYKSTYTDMGPASLAMNTINSIGVEGPNYHPSYDLKTNDKEDEIDHTLLKNVITTINNNTSSAEEFKTVIDEMVDVDSILKYQAMCWVIGNPDDSRNNSNNYYIYFNSITNKMSFIPYDFDRCLGILKDWEIHMEDVPYYTTKQNLDGNRPWQPNPLLWRLIISENDSSVDYSDKWPVIEEYQAKYQSYCVEYANRYLDVDKFFDFTEQFVYSNHDINNGGANNLSFATYAAAKLATIE